MSERPPKFMRQIREQKGEKAFIKASRKGGLVSGGKRSEEAAADKYYETHRKKEKEQSLAEANQHIQIDEEGNVLPPDELAA